jgi:LppX_LprAFG lipoprotein
MQRLLYVFLLFCSLAACTGTATEELPDTLTLLTDAANNIRAVSTFRMLIEQTGAEYLLLVNIGSGLQEVEFRQATAQVVLPNTMQGTTRLIVDTLTLDVGLFSQGPNQWVRIAGVWFNEYFAPGFDAGSLIMEGGGFDTALTGLREIQMVGPAELEDGSAVYHITGVANGADVAALTVGLIDSEGDVDVDIYISRDTHFPRRVVLKQPETVTADEPEPTTWTIDLYDINAPAELDGPEGVEVTAEATQEP